MNTKIEIVLFLPETHNEKVHFRCIGINENKVAAHNLAMISCDRAIKERYDSIRSQEMKDFCKIGLWLYQHSDSLNTRQIHQLNNILVMVSQMP